MFNLNAELVAASTVRGGCHKRGKTPGHVMVALGACWLLALCGATAVAADGVISEGDRAPAPVGSDRDVVYKWLQFPDLNPTGIDVAAQLPGINVVLADDYLCEVTGPLTEIHVWGSWWHDYVPDAVDFVLSIHADIPVGPGGWSVPGEPVWMYYFEAGTFYYEMFAFDLEEGFYIPGEEYYEFPGDTMCWWYVFPIPPGLEFIQRGTTDDPVVYWLDVQAYPYEECYFGWKTSIDHWNDDAVWGSGEDPPTEWFELRYPTGHDWAGASIDLAFEIIGEEWVCDPMPDGSACMDDPCPDPSDVCQPRCVNHDPVSGQNTVIECECRAPAECHADLSAATPHPCIEPDNGTGTATMPPLSCEYESPDEKWMIIEGLPPGTTIEMEGPLTNFICSGQHAMCSMPLPGAQCEMPGGSLGGDGHCYEATLDLEVVGTGSLAGFNRHLWVPMKAEAHTGPRNPGDPVQTFPTDMYLLFGELFGDPDFCTFRVYGGTDLGLPGPGETTLTQLPSGNFAVDSFFDITYMIEFEGCLGSVLEGMAGQTWATIRVDTGHPQPPVCVGGCEVGEECETTETPQRAGTVDICCDCVPAVCEPTPDGSACFLGTCPVPGDECEPRCSNFDPESGAHGIIECECRELDECYVDLTSGSPYPCIEPENGTGTATMPPLTAEYISPDDKWMIIDGLPPGTTIEMEGILEDFYCDAQPGAYCSMPLPTGQCEMVGGSLGGHGDCFDSTLDLTVAGTGSLAGFNRHLAVPMFGEAHTAPRNPGDPVQSFAADMYRLQGELFGDPDFCEFIVTAGTDNGLPGPGHTTLTQLPSGDFAVDSFFDITYQIQFEGCPASPLQYYAGTTTATIRIHTGTMQPPTCEGDCLPSEMCEATVTPQPDGTIETCCDCVPAPCEPLPDGSDCRPDETCALPADECHPVCANVDPDTGDTLVAECECGDVDDCQVEIPVGTAESCVRPGNGAGTTTLPALGCEYVSPDEKWMIIDGLPPGTTIEMVGILEPYSCNSGGSCSLPLPPGGCEMAGGTLGGHGDCFDSALDLTVTGTGELAGFNRHLAVPIFNEVHTAPRYPGDPVQIFDADMYRMIGELFGDPDFCEFIVTAGTDYGLPSPGEMTLTELPSGDFAVDSFFDITYQIEFEGCPSSQLDGYAGTTTATIRIQTEGGMPSCIGDCLVNEICMDTQTLQPDDTVDFCCDCEPDVCELRPDGLGCKDSTCAVPGETCQPRCAEFDPETGETTLVECDCGEPGECRPDLFGGTPYPCVKPDNGTGTATMPPIDCDYDNPNEKWMIIDGLPPGTTIELDGPLTDYICGPHPECSMQLDPGECETLGGSLGGHGHCYEATLDVEVTGTGSLAGFNRHLAVPMNAEAHTASRNPGDPVQSFYADMYRLEGELFGDPDFCALRVTAGTDNGLPSPGHTTLTQLPGGDYAVDSFFDIIYQIEFEGCPASQLEDYMGTTTATIRIHTGTVVYPSCTGDCLINELCEQTVTDNGDGTVDVCCDCVPAPCEPVPDGSMCRPGTCVEPEVCGQRCANFDPDTGDTAIVDCECRDVDECHVDNSSVAPYPCMEPDNGTGTATMPPLSCEYESPLEKWMIIDGLPPGTTIEMEGPITNFFCDSQPAPICSMLLPPGECETAGGSLGGDGHCYEAALYLDVTGTGELAGFNRNLAVPMFCEAHTALRNPGDPVQSFGADMYRIYGELYGDPDFCAFRIVAGSHYGLPSPGQTTMTRLPDGNYAVDSFFDITYQIEFEGCPDSVLADYAGTTMATIRIETGTGQMPSCIGDCPVGEACDTTGTANPDGTFDICCDCEPVGACCYGIVPSICVETTENDCILSYFGSYQGDGTTCDGTEACCVGRAIMCFDADALCCVNEMGGAPQGPGTQCTANEACCLPGGACADIDPLCCADEGGIPQGPGTQCTAVQACCLADDTCTDVDPFCCDDLGGVAQGAGTACTATEACCFFDGSCDEIDPMCCDDAGGDPSPIGSPICLGDANGNSINDACELPVKRPMAEDCATIAPGTRCSATGTCAVDDDCSPAGYETESHCVLAPADQPDLDNVCYVPKTRYLSIARNPEQMPNTARRVKLDDGTVLGWVGAPTQHPSTGLWLANIVSESDRVYQGQWPDVVHVMGCEIAHASLSNVTEQHCQPNPIAGETCVEHCYIVQAMSEAGDINIEGDYSEELMLCTNSTWGDTCSAPSGLLLPPDGIPGLDDIMGVIAHFQGNTGIAPLTWLDIDSSVGAAVPDQTMAIGDIMSAIAGFQGEAYPGLGPLGCP